MDIAMSMTQTERSRVQSQVAAFNKILEDQGDRRLSWVVTTS